MANYVFVDGFLLVNAVNWSTACKKITLNATVVDQKNTAFGSTWESRLGGLKDGKLTLQFNQDFAAAGLDATIWALLGTVQTFEIRSTSGARSTTNAAYTGSVLINDWSPIDGAVGDLADLSITWPTSGTVLRQTS